MEGSCSRETDIYSVRTLTHIYLPQALRKENVGVQWLSVRKGEQGKSLPPKLLHDQSPIPRTLLEGVGSNAMQETDLGASTLAPDPFGKAPCRAKDTVSQLGGKQGQSRFRTTKEEPFLSLPCLPSEPGRPPAKRGSFCSLV